MPIDASAFRHLNAVYEIAEGQVEVVDLVGRVYRLTLMRGVPVGQLVVFDVLVSAAVSEEDANPLIRQSGKTGAWYRVDRPIPFPGDRPAKECMRAALEQLDGDLA